MKQIKIKPSKVGSLHEHLGVAKGDKIPASKLKIKAGDSPAIRKKKQFALNARKWKHEFGGRAEYGAQLDQYNNLNFCLGGTQRCSDTLPLHLSSPFHYIGVLKFDLLHAKQYLHLLQD